MGDILYRETIMATYSRGTTLCQQLCNLASNPDFQKIVHKGKKSRRKIKKTIKKKPKLIPNNNPASPTS